MLQRSKFIQNFGNVKIKIWSYPRDILRSLIIGLKQDSNTPHKISNVMGFKHVYNDCVSGCNCKNKIENLCLKLSINVHRYNKVYIPLDLHDLSTCSHYTFLCELKYVENRCKNHISRTISVISNNLNNKCLLKLVEHSTNQHQKEDITENFHCQSRTENCKPEKCIKSSNNFDKNERFAIDLSKIMNLCLKFEIPPDEIIYLLKSFKEYRQNEIRNNNPRANCEDGLKSNESDVCGNDFKLIENKKIPSESRFSSTRNNNRNHPSTNFQHKRMKHFTIARSPSPKSVTQSCIDDCETDSSRSLTPDICSEYHDSVRSGSVKKFRNQGNTLRLTSTMVERDIHDIKGILQEIIILLRREHADLNCEIHTQCNEYMLNKENCTTSREIELLHSILDEWIKRKNIDLNTIQNKENIAKKTIHLSKANQCQEFDRNPENIPICERFKMARNENPSPNLKLKYFNNSINEDPSKKQLYFDNNKSVSLTNKLSNEAIKTALLSAGIPLHISDQICQMNFGGKEAGGTNIYYYVNDNGEINSAKNHKRLGKLYKETEIVIEQQKLKKIDKYDKNSNGENVSHILIDFTQPKVETDETKLQTPLDDVEVNVNKNYSLVNENESIKKEEKSRESEMRIRGSENQTEPKRRSLKRIKQSKFDENNGCTELKT